MEGYKFLKRLGEGTDGVIFLARDEEDGSLVAIKAISKKAQPGRARINNRLQRAAQEVHFLQELNHPNIIKVHKVIEGEEELFVVMDYADGGDLYEFMYKLNDAHELISDQLKESLVKRIFVQTLLAVEHCHRHNIAHRDLKPENILLTQDLDVRLADFGLATRFVPGQRFTSSVGSLVYASPELLRGRPYSAPEVDVWALGILLCELLCGVYPFGNAAAQTAEEDRHISQRIINCEFMLPGEEYGLISPSARDLICQILQPVEKRITIQEIKKHPWILSAFRFYYKVDTDCALSPRLHRAAPAVAQNGEDEIVDDFDDDDDDDDEEKFEVEIGDDEDKEMERLNGEIGMMGMGNSSSASPSSSRSSIRLETPSG
jgi:serine/threonine protein kinase